MNGRSVIRTSLKTAHSLAMNLIENLSDTEMLHRPHPQCNHIKWQLGHLILSNDQMVFDSLKSQKIATQFSSIDQRTDGFSKRYSRERANIDRAEDFDSKQILLNIFQTQHNQLLDTLNQLSNSDLDLPAVEAIRVYAPTIGAAYTLVGLHIMMHAGQWAVIRRQLGYPPLI